MDMKKNIIKYVAYLATALPLGGVGGGLVSCSDNFLDDMTVYGSFSEDKVYSSYAGAVDRVNTLYREMLPQACQGSGNGSNGQNTYTSTGSPEVWSKSSLEYGGFTDFTNPDQELDYTNVTDYFYVINKSDSPWGNSTWRTTTT